MKAKSIIGLQIIFSLVCFSLSSHAQQKQHLFQDTKLSFQNRVNDLVSKLTLEEKVAQMLNAAPATRLGLRSSLGEASLH